jgi:hypothetical protein
MRNIFNNIITENFPNLEKIKKYFPKEKGSDMVQGKTRAKKGVNSFLIFQIRLPVQHPIPCYAPKRIERRMSKRYLHTHIIASLFQYPRHGSSPNIHQWMNE